MYRVEVFNSQTDLATRMYSDYNASHKMGLDELLHIYVNSKPGTWRLISTTNKPPEFTGYDGSLPVNSGLIFFWSVPE
jgi:hypothetical protein